MPTYHPSHPARLALCLILVPVAFSQAPPLPVFSEAGERAGLAFRHQGNPTPDKYLIETMCGGVGLVDYDSDGLLDIFLVNSGRFRVEGKQGRIDRSKPELWNRLYRNNGDGTFTDVTEKAGVSGSTSASFGMGVAGDYDNDGYPDLYVTNFGRNVLYHNNRDGTFTDVTAKAGVAAGGWSISAGFLDYNNDGRVELQRGRCFRHRDGITDGAHVEQCVDRGVASYGNLRVFLHVSHKPLQLNGEGVLSRREEIENIAAAGIGLRVRR